MIKSELELEEALAEYKVFCEKEFDFQWQVKEFTSLKEENYKKGDIPGLTAYFAPFLQEKIKEALSVKTKQLQKELKEYNKYKKLQEKFGKLE